MWCCTCNCVEEYSVTRRQVPGGKWIKAGYSTVRKCEPIFVEYTLYLLRIYELVSWGGIMFGYIRGIVREGKKVRSPHRETKGTSNEDPSPVSYSCQDSLSPSIMPPSPEQVSREVCYLLH